MELLKERLSMREKQVEEMREEVRQVKRAKENEENSGNSAQISSLTEEVARLERELQEAHEMQGRERDVNETSTSTSTSTSHGSASHSNNNNNNTATKPLLFALSKQNELQIAREEISRLASSISDMASDKAEALERVEELEQQLEESVAKGERASTLGSGAEASVNAEYLKNILLQFLVAQTREEKKLLLDVLSAVLSFTEEEKKKGINSLDGSVGLRGVGEIVLDGVEGVKEEGLVGGVLSFVGLTPSRSSRRGGN